MNSSSSSAIEPTHARTFAYPISRWYVIPITKRIASALTLTAVRPTHITLLGLTFGVSAVGVLLAAPSAGPVAAVLVLTAWFADRTDGLLARNQNTASPFGAWLDANVDELHDVAWHTAIAFAAASLTATRLPWFLLIGFLAGKYLFVNGLNEERAISGSLDQDLEDNTGAGQSRWIRTAYHLPGDADIRIHLLLAALVSGLMTAELAIVAVYYNLRWIVRYGLVARRLGGQL